jgi:hypothetical protein
LINVINPCDGLAGQIIDALTTLIIMIQRNCNLQFSPAVKKKLILLVSNIYRLRVFFIFLAR